jgi:(2R)-ethylmalonyl-CoA mutase
MGEEPRRDTPSRDKPARDKPVRDKPWIFRTYAGHSTATASNELYRKNLSKGQTSICRRRPATTVIIR